MPKSDAKKLTKLVAGSMNANENIKATEGYATATKKRDTMTVSKPKY